MTKYIVKQKAISALTNEANTHSNPVKRAYTRAAALIEQITAEDVQPVDRWISCKDKMPEDNTLVLCYARSKTGEGNSYFLGALAHGEFWFLKVNDIGHVSCPVLHWEVTHWQPLPEPPKDGDTYGI